jgi:hypothetical protein
MLCLKPPSQFKICYTDINLSLKFHIGLEDDQHVQGAKILQMTTLDTTQSSNIMVRTVQCESSLTCQNCVQKLTAPTKSASTGLPRLTANTTLTQVGHIYLETPISFRLFPDLTSNKQEFIKFLSSYNKHQYFRK